MKIERTSRAVSIYNSTLKLYVTSFTITFPKKHFTLPVLRYLFQKSIIRVYTIPFSKKHLTLPVLRYHFKNIIHTSFVDAKMAIQQWLLSVQVPGGLYWSCHGRFSDSVHMCLVARLPILHNLNKYRIWASTFRSLLVDDLGRPSFHNDQKSAHTCSVSFHRGGKS